MIELRPLTPSSTSKGGNKALGELRCGIAIAPLSEVALALETRELRVRTNAVHLRAFTRNAREVRLLRQKIEFEFELDFRESTLPRRARMILGSDKNGRHFPK
jgi:hypothetical protein